MTEKIECGGVHADDIVYCAFCGYIKPGTPVIDIRRKNEEKQCSVCKSVGDESGMKTGRFVGPHVCSWTESVEKPVVTVGAIDGHYVIVSRAGTAILTPEEAKVVRDRLCYLLGKAEFEVTKKNEN